LTGIFGVYEYIFTPVISPDGEVELIAGTTRDISERKRMEEELKDSEAQLSAIMEQLPVGVGLLDNAGHFVYSNSAWKANVPGEKMPSRNPEQIDRWKTFDSDGKLVPPTNWPGARALRGEIVNGMEFVLPAEDGNELWKLIHAAPYRLHRNEIAGAVVVAQDITARKYAERKLHELTANLEKQVSERTAIAENRSKQLQSLAIELIETEERERRKFAHLLHDDLQQMLAAAKMQLQALSDTNPNELALVDVGLILNESIEKSRRLSHELSPPVLLHSGLTGALQWLGLRMGEQFNLKVELEVSTEPVIDNTPLKTFLFRSVQELLFNVVKHSGVNRARIVLSGSNSNVTLLVIDEGKGLDPDTLKKVNTGFGLMTIRERASYIGGSLSIESAPGKGSRFKLSVPLHVTDDDSRYRQALTAQPRSRNIQRIVEGSAMFPQNQIEEMPITRVLFVDDHHVMRQGLVNLVSGQPGIAVVGEAANGQEALEQTFNLKPDVVIMDISMPGMDGIEATRRIKAELPDVRVIGLSMHMDDQLARSIHDAGAEIYIAKTASPKELLQAIYGDYQRKNRADLI
jgi:signal transduction histidine kinase/CheY-like chemotaxis protein